MKNCLTVDCEDWFHAFATISRVDWQAYQPRLAVGTAKILDCLAAYGQRATFFVLGAAAEQNPAVVRQIAAAGHEIASHGYAHQPVYRQTRRQFRQDVARSLEILQDLTDQPVYGYRAPWWSITRHCLWALDILAQLGLKYDSSIFPVRAGYYGIPAAPRFIHRYRTATQKTLWEVPPLTYRLGAINWPAGGGFYLRVAPPFYHVRALQAANRAGQPGLVYIHPWEWDPHQPRLAVTPLQWLIHYTALRRSRPNFRNLLQQFTFGPIREVLRETFGDHSLLQ